jgi:hypothetical protein
MTENNVAAQAGDEPMPCPFCGKHEHAPDCYFTLQEIMLSGLASDLSMVPDVIAAWNRRVSPRATADVERDKAIKSALVFGLKVRGYLTAGTDTYKYGVELREMIEMFDFSRIATTKPGA